MKIRKLAGYSLVGDTPQQQKEMTTPIDCPACEYNGPFIIKHKEKGNSQIDVLCPNCQKQDSIMSLQAEVNSKGQKLVDNEGRFKVKAPVARVASNLPRTKNKETGMISNKRKNDAFQNQTPNSAGYDQMANSTERVASKLQSSAAKEKKNKGDYNGARVENMHEDVCPQDQDASICPCTKEREEYKNKNKVMQMKASVETKKTYADLGEVLHPEGLTAEAKKILQTPACELCPLYTVHAKSNTIKTASMYDAVFMQPGGSQWCPKLRRAVSMFVCGEHCIDGRRVPQVKNAEQYSDYIEKGGDPNGYVECGYKDWMNREMDKFYPGWVEDRIKEKGGDASGTPTDIGVRKMNLEDGERRHLPRYPEEKLIERQMDVEKRHKFYNPKNDKPVNPKKLSSNSALEKKADND